MRRSQITVIIITKPENEENLLSAIVAYLKEHLAAGNIAKAQIRTEEIDIPTEIEIS